MARLIVRAPEGEGMRTARRSKLERSRTKYGKPCRPRFGTGCTELTGWLDPPLGVMLVIRKLKGATAFSVS
jgi:hypothetical protein